MRSIFVFILALVLSGVAPSYAESLPKAYQGYWSFPDCTSDQDRLIITDTHILSATPYDAVILSVRGVVQPANFIVVNTDMDRLALHRTVDGILKAYAVTQDQATQQVRDWYDIAGVDDGQFEYTHCDSDFLAWEPKHSAGVRAMQHMTDITKGCKTGIDDQCKRAIFKAFDRDRDQLLNAAELANVSEAILYLSMATQSGPKIEDLTMAHRQWQDYASALAHKVKQHADMLGQKTDYETLMRFMPLLWQDRDLDNLKIALQRLKPFFPFLGDVNLTIALRHNGPVLTGYGDTQP